MKKIILFAIAAFISITGIAVETNSTPEQAEANYTRVINGRANDILKILALSDTNQAASVHSIIVAQYRALNAWHEENNAKLKEAKSDTNATGAIRVSLKRLHDEFLAKLAAANLKSDQIEKVKDKMTYGKVQFTYTGYVTQYPNLTAEQKEKIMDLLKEAREDAMDGGSSEEKTAIFQRYKGKINNYLSKQGIHPEKKKGAPETNAPAN